ncbi:MAG: FtsX-like permease family protein [Bacteroidales bacterium]|nr:FtsX-like permease family protein [Bacteroidales bacterium]
MKLHWFIAKRYLTSPKTTHIINIISTITAVSFAIGTMALVIIISIFNGLESLIIKRFNSFDPDLKVIPIHAKTFVPDENCVLTLNSIHEIDRYAFTIEDKVLVKYHDIYHPFTIKGVDLTYADMTGLDTMVVEGRFSLMYQNQPVAVVGMGVVAHLSIGLNFVSPLKIYAPNRLANIHNSPEQAFIMKPIYPIGIYSVDPEMDNYVIVPIQFTRELFQYNKEVSSLEIKLKSLSDSDKIEQLLQSTFGNQFDVRNRFEQHQFLYQIMKSEKFIVFAILLFILLIASFNITASLTMLIIEKKEDIETLRSIGFSMKDIRKVFLFEGWLISIIGTISGIALGLIFCFLQHEFGIIPMDANNPDAFIVSAYPVEVRILDLFIIFMSVLTIGFLSSRFPVRFITRRYLPDRYNDL